MPPARVAPEAEVVQVGDAIGQRAKRRGLVQGAVWPVRVPGRDLQGRGLGEVGPAALVAAPAWPLAVSR